MAHHLRTSPSLCDNHHICETEQFSGPTFSGGSHSTKIRGICIRSDSSLAIFFGHARAFLLGGSRGRVVHYRHRRCQRGRGPGIVCGEGGGEGKRRPRVDEGVELGGWVERAAICSMICVRIGEVGRLGRREAHLIIGDGETETITQRRNHGSPAPHPGRLFFCFCFCLMAKVHGINLI
jgi:hypothetical protein